MKLHTPDNNELMQVNSIERDGDQLIVRGVIMENMPVKAVLKPEQLRAAFSLLTVKLVVDSIVLLFKRSAS